MGGGVHKYGRWGLQEWEAGSTSVGGGVHKCGRWGPQVWEVGSTSMGGGVYKNGRWGLQALEEWSTHGHKPEALMKSAGSVPPSTSFTSF